MNAKAALKRGVRQLAGRLAPALLRLPREPSLLILMYHRVLPAHGAEAAREEPGMWVAPETLRMHGQVLREFFEPVHLDAWLQSAARGERLPRRAVALTFDDGWRDNYDFAFPILQELALPATIFLVSQRIGRGSDFWANRLGALLERHFAAPGTVRFAGVLAETVAAISAPLPGAGFAEAKTRAIDACKALSDAEMERLVTLSEQSGPPPPVGERKLLNREEILRLRDSGLVRFGSHTRHHPRLQEGLDEKLLHEELEGSRRELEVLLGCPVPLFCYPMGEASAAADALVRRYYDGAMTTCGGMNVAASDRWRLRRVGVHEDISHTRPLFLARLVQGLFAGHA
jgi:peptidoglycan/xylan/chitin deacetylase (PgdA/CDA1 family)